MKKILIILSMLIALNVYAGSKKLRNGAVAMWQDQTEVIQYNSYRVVISLSDKCDYNVYGSVSLGGQSKNFFIHAGETSGYVDFGGLENGRRYSVSVQINN